MRFWKLLLLVLLTAGCAAPPAPPANYPDDVAARVALYVVAADVSEDPDDLPVEPEVEVERPEPEPPEPPEPEAEEPVTIKSLCEPVDSRRPYPNRAERKATKATIRAVCAEMGVAEESCPYFERIVSLRESSYRPWVRHKLQGDKAAAMRSYMAAAHVYGWEVHWPHKERLAGNLDAVEVVPRAERKQNPWFPERDRWLTGGLGLGGLNVAYHLPKFDPMAPPEILCDPVINVMVQIYLARSAVQRFGATNWIEVQAVYAGRTTYDERGHAVADTCRRRKAAGEECPDKIARRELGLLRRCKAQEMDCYATPDLGSSHARADTSVRKRYEVAEKIRGAPLPTFDQPQSALP